MILQYDIHLDMIAEIPLDKTLINLMCDKLFSMHSI